jgi:secondary thiamine-phosphate synthase enzyme
MAVFEFTLTTPREGLLDVTDLVREAVAKDGVADGAALVYCPHTTAGVTINENADPDVQIDILLGLDAAFPARPEFRHAEGNSAAHLKASAIGASVTVIVSDGRLLLGTWQSVFFCEFDGPRKRRLVVKLIKS